MKKSYVFNLLISASVLGLTAPLGFANGSDLTESDSDMSNRSSICLQSGDLDSETSELNEAFLNYLRPIVADYNRGTFDCRKFLTDYAKINRQYALVSGSQSVDPQGQAAETPDFLVLRSWDAIREIENTKGNLEGEDKGFFYELMANLLLTHKIFPLDIYEGIDDANPQTCFDVENAFINNLIDNLGYDRLSALVTGGEGENEKSARYKLASQAYIYVGQLNLYKVDRGSHQNSRETRERRVRDAFNSFRSAIAFQEKYQTTKLPYLLAIHTLLHYGAHTSKETNQETIDRLLLTYWDAAKEKRTSSTKNSHRFPKAPKPLTTTDLVEKHGTVRHITKTLGGASVSSTSDTSEPMDVDVEDMLENVHPQPLHANPNSLPLRQGVLLNTVGMPSDARFQIDERSMALQNVSGAHNDCFFNALGLRRQEQVDRLIQNLDTPAVAQMVDNDRRRVGFQGALQSFVNQHIAGNQMIGFEQMGELIGDPLADRNTIDQAQYTTADAIAHMNNFGLRIYAARAEGQGGLILQHEYIPANATTVAYLYHGGRYDDNHFQALIAQGQKRGRADTIDSDDEPIVIRKRQRENLIVSETESEGARENVRTKPAAKRVLFYTVPHAFPPRPTEEALQGLKKHQKLDKNAFYRAEFMACALGRCGFAGDVEGFANEISSDGHHKNHSRKMVFADHLAHIVVEKLKVQGTWNDVARTHLNTEELDELLTILEFHQKEWKRKASYVCPTQFPQAPDLSFLNTLKESQKEQARAIYRSAFMACALGQCGFTKDVEDKGASPLPKEHRNYHSQPARFAPELADMVRQKLMDGKDIKSAYRSILSKDIQVELKNILTSFKNRKGYVCPETFPEKLGSTFIASLNKTQKAWEQSKYASAFMACALGKCGFADLVVKTGMEKKENAEQYLYSAPTRFRKALRELAQEKLQDANGQWIPAVRTYLSADERRELKVLLADGV